MSICIIILNLEHIIYETKRMEENNMNIKEKKIYDISISGEEKDKLIEDIKKLNEGLASLEELSILTDIYGFFTNN